MRLPDSDQHSDEEASDLAERMKRLTREIARLTSLLENLRLQQYVRVLLNTRRMAWISFFNGLLGGLGGALGATVVLALLLYLLTRLEVVPHIGHFISEIVKIVRKQG